jgi:hypothetical protein
MSATNGAMTAYPFVLHGSGGTEYSHGLTKREYFAAIALQGLLASPNRDGHLMGYAEAAVRVADMLIAELNKAGA